MAISIDEMKKAARLNPKFKVSRGDEIIKKVTEINLEEDSKNETNDTHFWKEVIDKNGNVTDYKFIYHKCYEFLQTDGFFRYQTIGNDFILVRLDEKVVYETKPWQIKDFVIDFVKKLGNMKVLDMLYRASGKYLGPESLSHLELKKIKFNKSTATSHFLYFKSHAWKITSSDITPIQYNNLDNFVWSNSIKDFDCKIHQQPPFTIRWDPEKKHFDLNFSDHQGDFIKYLYNTSRIFWMKEEKGTITSEELYKQKLNFISKVCAAGHLLHTYYNKSRPWAVIGMDHDESVVGTNNGGTGKSLFGSAIRQILRTHLVDGKRKNVDEDKFIWDGVDERTEFLCIDETRLGFNFELFYSVASGLLIVEAKNKSKFQVPTEDIPKLYISTNNAITSNGASDKRRQYIITFSSYYNPERNPESELGRKLFDDWDDSEWELFFNAMAMCVKYYLIFGKVEANDLSIKKRQLRQQIGEDFMDWAEVYFSDPAKFDIEIERKVLQDHFFDNIPNQLKQYYTPTKFKKKLLNWCEYMGYIFNPMNRKDDGTPGAINKRNSQEFFTVSQTDTYLPF